MSAQSVTAAAAPQCQWHASRMRVKPTLFSGQVFDRLVGSQSNCPFPGKVTGRVLVVGNMAYKRACACHSHLSKYTVVVGNRLGVVFKAYAPHCHLHTLAAAGHRQAVPVRLLCVARDYDVTTLLQAKQGAGKSVSHAYSGQGYMHTMPKVNSKQCVRAVTRCDKTVNDVNGMVMPTAGWPAVTHGVHNHGGDGAACSKTLLQQWHTCCAAARVMLLLMTSCSSYLQCNRSEFREQTSSISSCCVQQCTNRNCE